MKSRTTTILFVSIGVVLVVVGVVVFHVPNWVIADSFPLLGTPSSDTWRRWQQQQQQRRQIKVYFFDLTNGDGVERGEMPIVEERGPYVYRETIPIEVLGFQDDFEKIAFRQNKIYEFDREASVGDENETVRTLNMPVFMIFDALENAPTICVSRINAYLDKKHNNAWNLTMEKTVKQLLWGFESQPLTKLNQPQLRPLKEHFDSTTFGFFVNRNWFAKNIVMDTGVDDLKNLGIIRSLDGKSALDLWGSKEANMLNGTDGSLFHPSIRKEETLYVFFKEMFRSISASYTGEEEVSNIPTWVLTPPNDLLSHSDDGFCWPKPCLPAGVLRISHCRPKEQKHLAKPPLAISHPHLCHADEEVQKNVTGLHPDPEKHVTRFHVEPKTGIVIQSALRVQFNGFISAIANVPRTEKLANGTETIVPIFWMEEGFLADDEFASSLKSGILGLFQKTKYSFYALLATGIVCILIPVIAYIHASRKITEPVTEKNPPKKMSDVKRNSVCLDQPISYNYDARDSVISMSGLPMQDKRRLIK